MAATPAFASFEQEWLDAHPEYAIASIFLPSAQRRRENAFAVLVHELGAAAHMREPQVATAKLSWWRGELAGAVAGRGNHPIARELFADEVVSTDRPGIVAGAGRRGARAAGQHGSGDLARVALASGPPFTRSLRRSKTRCPAVAMPTSSRMQHCGQLPSCCASCRRSRRQRQPAVAAGPARAPRPDALRHCPRRPRGARRCCATTSTPLQPCRRNALAHHRCAASINASACAHDRALLAAAREASDPLCVPRPNTCAPAALASLWVAWREARALAREN